MKCSIRHIRPGYVTVTVTCIEEEESSDLFGHRQGEDGERHGQGHQLYELELERECERELEPGRQKRSSTIKNYENNGSENYIDNDNDNKSGNHHIGLSRQRRYCYRYERQIQWQRQLRTKTQTQMLTQTIPKSILTLTSLSCPRGSLSYLVLQVLTRVLITMLIRLNTDTYMYTFTALSALSATALPINIPIRNGPSSQQIHEKYKSVSNSVFYSDGSMPILTEAKYASASASASASLITSSNSDSDSVSESVTVTSLLRSRSRSLSQHQHQHERRMQNNDKRTSTKLVSSCSICNASQYMANPLQFIGTINNTLGGNYNYTTTAKTTSTNFTNNTTTTTRININNTCIQLEQLGQLSQFTINQCAVIRSSLVPKLCGCTSLLVTNPDPDGTGNGTSTSTSGKGNGQNGTSTVSNSTTSGKGSKNTTTTIDTILGNNNTNTNTTSNTNSSTVTPAKNVTNPANPTPSNSNSNSTTTNNKTTTDAPTQTPTLRPSSLSSNNISSTSTMIPVQQDQSTLVSLRLLYVPGSILSSSSLQQAKYTNNSSTPNDIPLVQVQVLETIVAKFLRYDINWTRILFISTTNNVTSIDNMTTHEQIMNNNLTLSNITFANVSVQFVQEMEQHQQQQSSSSLSSSDNSTNIFYNNNTVSFDDGYTTTNNKTTTATTTMMTRDEVQYYPLQLLLNVTISFNYTSLLSSLASSSSSMLPSILPIILQQQQQCTNGTTGTTNNNTIGPDTSTNSSTDECVTFIPSSRLVERLQEQSKTTPDFRAIQFVELQQYYNNSTSTAGTDNQSDDTNNNTNNNINNNNTTTSKNDDEPNSIKPVNNSAKSLMQYIGMFLIGICVLVLLIVGWLICLGKSAVLMKWCPCCKRYIIHLTKTKSGTDSSNSSRFNDDVNGSEEEEDDEDDHDKRSRQIGMPIRSSTVYTDIVVENLSKRVSKNRKSITNTTAIDGPSITSRTSLMHNSSLSYVERYDDGDDDDNHDDDTYLKEVLPSKSKPTLEHKQQQQPEQAKVSNLSEGLPADSGHSTLSDEVGIRSSSKLRNYSFDDDNNNNNTYMINLDDDDNNTLTENNFRSVWDQPSEEIIGSRRKTSSKVGSKSKDSNDDDIENNEVDLVVRDRTVPPPLPPTISVPYNSNQIDGNDDDDIDNDTVDMSTMSALAFQASALPRHPRYDEHGNPVRMSAQAASYYRSIANNDNTNSDTQDNAATNAPVTNLNGINSIDEENIDKPWLAKHHTRWGTSLRNKTENSNFTNSNNDDAVSVGVVHYAASVPKAPGDPSEHQNIPSVNGSPTNSTSSKKSKSKDNSIRGKTERKSTQNAFHSSYQTTSSPTATTSAPTITNSTAVTDGRISSGKQPVRANFEKAFDDVMSSYSASSYNDQVSYREENQNKVVNNSKNPSSPSVRSGSSRGSTTSSHQSGGGGSLSAPFRHSLNMPDSTTIARGTLAPKFDDTTIQSNDHTSIDGYSVSSLDISRMSYSERDNSIVRKRQQRRKDWIQRIVQAPAGKLDILVDTTIDGPMIHRVNDGSPLTGKVYSGDIIVAIDSIGTQAMSASAIMKLMISTAHQPRQLTVLSERSNNKKPLYNSADNVSDSD